MNAKEIAEQNTILRVVVGSQLHGLSLEGAEDRDEMGVCIEPPEYVIGLKHFEQWVSRDRAPGERSQPGDLDLTIYSLRKWCRLALAGNPTILLLLFAPGHFFVDKPDALGVRLQSLAPAFISKKVFAPFHGYAVAQRQRLVGERGSLDVHRRDLIGKYGYDVKYAMHMLRLGFQGVEILDTGRLTLPMKQPIREYLMNVRRGDIPLQDVLTMAGELEHVMETAVESSPLPDEPDHEAVHRFLFKAYQEWWKCVDQAKEIKADEQEA